MYRLVLILLLLVSTTEAGKKKPMGNMMRKPDQKVEINNAGAALGTANRKCENYVWAAIVETMMRGQQVPIPQNDWAERTSNGMRCYPSLDDYAQRAQALNGDYTLNDGKKVHIHAEFFPGTPQPDAMIYSLRIGRPLMVVWNGRPYMLYGLLYDELIHTTGKAKQYVVREMQLLDAALPPDAKSRALTIKKDETTDQIAGLSGVMQVTVEPRNFYDIPR